jgi:alpha-tubulin suppressor-like RCC1 family protein
MSRMKHTLVTVSIIILITNIALALDWREDATAIDISGGEDHTLLLTKNKAVWACGDMARP